MVSPQAKREAVSMLMTERDYGVTRACGLLQISRSLSRYRSRRPACAKLCERIREIAEQKRRYGYRRIYVRLRREGWAVNRKRVYRLYREAGLLVRRPSGALTARQPRIGGARELEIVPRLALVGGRAQ